MRIQQSSPSRWTTLWMKNQWDSIGALVEEFNENKLRSMGALSDLCDDDEARHKRGLNSKWWSGKARAKWGILMMIPM